LASVFGIFCFNFGGARKPDKHPEAQVLKL